MPPAPASIATPPSPRSAVSWNPAVPPPPVGGAPFGIGLVVGDGDEFPCRVVGELADGLGDGLFERVAPGLGEVLPGLGVVLPGLGVVVPAVPLEEETAGLAEVLLVGDDVGGSAAEGEDVVQADTAAQAKRAAMPQPTARHVAGIAPVPTFTQPPHRLRRLKAGPRKRQGP